MKNSGAAGAETGGGLMQKLGVSPLAI